MADLSTLDVTAPPGTEDRSLGDDRIRETRLSTVTSFGIEHALAGPHKFPMGAPGVLPAAGNAGRIFFDTTNNYALLDSGTIWNFLKTTGFQYSQSLTNIPYTTNDTTLLTLTSVVVPTACNLLGFAIISFATTGAAVDTVKMNISYGADSLLPKDQDFAYPGTGANVQAFVMASKVLTAATYTISLQIKGTAVGGATTRQALALLMV